jgi:DNA-binding transcriptional MerR regulator
VAAGDKDPGALRTIGELSRELGVAQHILRYWESRFPQLKPMQRAGNRRYYRPADVELARRINRLLNQDGYTVKGVQKLLREKGDADAVVETRAALEVAPLPDDLPRDAAGVDVFRLIAIRNSLAAAIDD